MVAAPTTTADGLAAPKLRKDGEMRDTQADGAADLSADNPAMMGNKT